jgi:hypothetical protein
MDHWKKIRGLVFIEVANLLFLICGFFVVVPILNEKFGEVTFLVEGSSEIILWFSWWDQYSYGIVVLLALVFSISVCFLCLYFIGMSWMDGRGRREEMDEGQCAIICANFVRIVCVVVLLSLIGASRGEVVGVFGSRWQEISCNDIDYYVSLEGAGDVIGVGGMDEWYNTSFTCPFKGRGRFHFDEFWRERDEILLASRRAMEGESFKVGYIFLILFQVLVLVGGICSCCGQLAYRGVERREASRVVPT